ncbi:hypothetical protein NBRC116593_36330 [Sulfitobacter pacificus]
METRDGLPTPVRQWVAQTALPWSPASDRRIWSKSCAEGLLHNAALARCQVDACTPARDQQSPALKSNSMI